MADRIEWKLLICLFVELCDWQNGRANFLRNKVLNENSKYNNLNVNLAS